MLNAAQSREERIITEMKGINSIAAVVGIFEKKEKELNARMLAVYTAAQAAMMSDLRLTGYDAYNGEREARKFRLRENIGRQQAFSKMEDLFKELADSLRAFTGYSSYKGSMPSNDKQMLKALRSAVRNGSDLRYSQNIEAITPVRVFQGTGLPSTFEGTGESHTFTTSLYLEDALHDLMTARSIDKPRTIDTIQMILNEYTRQAMAQKAEPQSNGQFHGLFTSYWAGSGAVDDSAIFISDNAEVLRVLIQYMEMTGDKSFMPLAKDLSGYLVSLQDNRDGGL